MLLTDSSRDGYVGDAAQALNDTLVYPEPLEEALEEFGGKLTLEEALVVVRGALGVAARSPYYDTVLGTLYRLSSAVSQASRELS